jgi:sortase A
VNKALRILGRVLIACGVLALAWALVVWRWQDPFTALYTKIQQDRLARQYDGLVRAYRPPRLNGASLAAVQRVIAQEARRYRLATHEGEAIGRIVVPRLHLNMVLVDGTDEGSLQKGPGRDLRSYMPGEGRLVYIAGHRTTYAAPFSHIDRLRRGDLIRIEMPYGTFDYTVTGQRVVRASDLSVLRSKRYEQVALQACHPRFFATHRLIVFGKLAAAKPADDRQASS